MTAGIASADWAHHFASPADHLREIERVRTAALVQRDMAVALPLHAPHYQLISPSGVSFTRDRYLGLIGDGSLVYRQWTAGPMAVRISAQMAMLRYRATLAVGDGVGQGQPFECWHTDTYECLDGAWQAVWSQATRIASPDR